jgi:hypothetical protein
VYGILEFTTLDDEVPGGPSLFRLSTSSRHGYTDTMSWWGPLWAMSWWGLLAMDIRTKGRVERGIEPPVLSYILQRPIHS